MTIDEAIKQIEEIVEDNQRIVDTHCFSDELTIEEIYGDDTEIIEERLAVSQKRADDFRQLAKWLKELKQLREQTRWIPVSEKYPKIEDEYKYFLVTDDKGKVSVQEFFISLDEEPQPYFSGMVNVIAWMPLPRPYKAENEVSK